MKFEVLASGIHLKFIYKGIRRESREQSSASSTAGRKSEKNSSEISRKEIWQGDSHNERSAKEVQMYRDSEDKDPNGNKGQTTAPLEAESVFY